MSLSRSLSPTNTHTNAVLALAKSMDIRVIKVILTPICMAITHLFVSIPSPHALPFPCTTIIFTNLSDPLSSILAQGHAYILSILILVCVISPMYVHVIRLLCFIYLFFEIFEILLPFFSIHCHSPNSIYALYTFFVIKPNLLTLRLSLPVVSDP